MVPIKINIANKENYGKTKTQKNQYIVIHYTANDGDRDESNGNYFKNTVTKTSAHYFVDSDSITQSVPDNKIAYHCGTKSGYKHPSCRNSNSIGIELCDDVKNGVIYPSKAIIKNALDLTKILMKKYGIPASNVIRHYDVTGKLCPEYWVNDVKWKSEFWNNLSTTNTTSSSTLASEFKPYTVKVVASSLNVRSGAGMFYSVNTVIKKGQVYTIVAENNGWGKLKSGAGWISLKYVLKT